MPTNRFNRLPEEKKQIIREAAIREFARVPFEKASINRIIKNAAISRGSFYTYFTDKQDVVCFIFEDSHERMKKQCLETLEKNNGDYFIMLKGLFEFFVEELQSTKDMMEMARNVFSYQENVTAMGFKSEWDFDLDFSDESEAARETYQLFDHVNQVGWRLKSKDEFKALMMMGMAALLFAMAQFYKKPEEVDVVRRLFDLKLEMLQYGVYQTDQCQH